MSEVTGFLSVADACRNLCISHSYFYMLVKRGDITPVKLGRRTLVPRSEFERLLGTRPENNIRRISTDTVSASTTKLTHTDI